MFPFVTGTRSTLNEHDLIIYISNLEYNGFNCCKERWVLLLLGDGLP